jgi:guanylate kinase
MKTHIFSRFFKSSAALGKTLTPHLERRSEFEEILRDYRPSPETIKILAQTPLVTLIAPTATGRNTIISRLESTGRYLFLISDTTRPPRQNNGVWERNGHEYYFRTEEEVLTDIRDGKFVEAEIIHSQQVSGTSAREVKRAHDAGDIAITDVDIEGGINLANLKPDTVTICLLPPSFDAWLARIKGREHLEDLNLHRRLRQATKVLRLAMADSRFVFVVNDKLDDAIATVDALATQGIHYAEKEKQARQLAKELYSQTITYLKEYAPDMVPTA